MKGQGQAGGVLFSEQQFKASVSFWYEGFETDPLADPCDWEAQKLLIVPQGASRCVLEVSVAGYVSDTSVGRLVLDTRKDILDQSAAFWSRPQTYRLKKGDKVSATLVVSWKRMSLMDEQNFYMPILTGLDNESGLGNEIRKTCKKKFDPPILDDDRNIEGERKLDILSRTL